MLYWLQITTNELTIVINEFVFSYRVELNNGEPQIKQTTDKLKMPLMYQLWRARLAASTTRARSEDILDEESISQLSKLENILSSITDSLIEMLTIRRAELKN